jgi:isochorismate pyruvate lyase
MSELPRNPEHCETMEEVRAGVDAVDRELVALLVRRQGYMEAAARIKPSADQVRVPWRIEQVVENVLAEARKTGLSPRIAEPVWRVLIEKSIAHEAEIWHDLRSSSGVKSQQN